jgi:DNA-binding LacI/PurR family transcriptional regulator
VATIDDVVRSSGISRSTVFRFLGGQNVRPQARDAIQAALRELNYFYNPRQTRSDIVLVVSVLERFEGQNVFADMVAGVMNRAAGLGLHVKLHAGRGPVIPEPKSRQAAGARYGVIIVGKSDPEEEAEAEELERLGLPHVFVNRVFVDPRRSFVSVDLRRAAREAVEHLLSLGRVAIATWGRPGEYRLDREKMAGYRDAHAARGLPAPSGCYSYEKDGDLEDVARRLFSSASRPDAWFGLSDTHLMRLANVIREFDLRIPEDIALVGMDDIEPSRFFSPPLTTVRIPFREAGAAAVDVLLGLVENPLEDSVKVLLKHELVVRESCGARAAGRAGQ